MAAPIAGWRVRVAQLRQDAAPAVSAGAAPGRGWCRAATLTRDAVRELGHGGCASSRTTCGTSGIVAQRDRLLPTAPVGRAAPGALSSARPHDVDGAPARAPSESLFTSSARPTGDSGPVASGGCCGANYQVARPAPRRAQRKRGRALHRRVHELRYADRAGTARVGRERPRTNVRETHDRPSSPRQALERRLFYTATGILTRPRTALQSQCWLCKPKRQGYTVLQTVPEGRPFSPRFHPHLH